MTPQNKNLVFILATGALTAVTLLFTTLALMCSLRTDTSPSLLCLAALTTALAWFVAGFYASVLATFHLRARSLTQHEQSDLFERLCKKVLFLKALRRALADPSR